MTEATATADAERARLVRKLSRLRAQATLQLDGLRGLQDLERDTRQRVTWLREEAKRQQEQTPRRGALDGFASHPATRQAPGVQAATQARVDRLTNAASLIEREVLPEIAQQLQTAQASWTAAARTAEGLTEHLRSELEQWGIADAL